MVVSSGPASPIPSGWRKRRDGGRKAWSTKQAPPRCPVRKSLFLRPRRDRHPAYAVRQCKRENGRSAAETNEMRPGRRSTKYRNPRSWIGGWGQHGQAIMAAVNPRHRIHGSARPKTVPPQSRGRFSSSSVLVCSLLPPSARPDSLEESPGCWGSPRPAQTIKKVFDTGASRARIRPFCHPWLRDMLLFTMEDTWTALRKYGILASREPKKGGGPAATEPWLPPAQLAPNGSALLYSATHRVQRSPNMSFERNCLVVMLTIFVLLVALA